MASGAWICWKDFWSTLPGEDIPRLIVAAPTNNARYHFYFNPDNQQIYQLCQMATSLTADLGIDKPVRRVGFGKGTSIPFNAFVPNINLEDAEAKRAYLGCYYIASA